MERTLTLHTPGDFSLKACGPLVNDIFATKSLRVEQFQPGRAKEMSMQSSTSRALGKLSDVDWLCGLELAYLALHGLARHSKKHVTTSGPRSDVV